MHLKMVEAFRKELDTYHSDLAESRNAHTATTEASTKQLEAFNALVHRAESTISSFEAEIQRLTTIKHLKGEPGESVMLEDVLEAMIPHLPKPDSVDHNQIVRKVLELIPNPESLKQKELDREELFNEFVTRIQKERLIDVSHIKNSESFLFNGKKYKIEELMRGAGGSNTGGNSTPLTPIGTVNGINQVFGVVSEPSSVVADGITYYENHGYSYASLQITMDSPPAQYIRYYA